jgi:hypothetical protein
MRPACAGAEEAQPAAGSSARAEEDAAFGEASVGYVFSEKKRGSLLTPEFIDRARCGGARAARGVGAAWPAFSRGSSVGSDSRPCCFASARGLRFVPVDPFRALHEQARRQRRARGVRTPPGAAMAGPRFVCFSGADAGLRGAACAGWPPV